MSFEARLKPYVARVDAFLDQALPASDAVPGRLHEAMRYAVFNGGKRVRPLLVYAAGEVLGTDPALLDAPAAAIELIHAFSLVHDDLPAMDDDDLRRGKPTVHRAFDEATAILAADALQPLAFETMSQINMPGNDPDRWLAAIRVVASACGSLGMTGGQAIDLNSEGRKISRTELETMHNMKTGCLIRACVESACVLSASCTPTQQQQLVDFSVALGLAFQVKDDILDVIGDTQTLGKQAGADQERSKATWPGQFGLEDAKKRCDELMDQGLASLESFGERAEPLHWMANFIIARNS
ncbi:MAG: polyprenyl synthetase family protein [Pseudomonadota bacterium]